MSKYTLMQMRAELTGQQQNAAQLLVENEFKSKLDGGKRSLDEIGAEVGVSRQSLWTWKKDPVFIAYMAYLSDRHLDAQRALVDSQLMRLIEGTSNNGNPSIKALELWYKLNSRLVERSVIEHSDGRPKMTDAEISEEIKSIADGL
ncbi:phBC6A51 family helix-turn-helix protein [Sporosarcina sp. ITBMC105]